MPVFKDEVLIDGPAGDYVLAAHMEQGGSPAGDRVSFHVSDPAALPVMRATVTLWGIDDATTSWLQGHGVHCRPFGTQTPAEREVILVGDPGTVLATEDDWRALADQMARGSTVVFLSPQAFRREADTVGWLPLAVKGRCHEYSNWLYHREDVARPHPIFDGLPGRGILDWDYYGPVIPLYVFEGQDTPDDIAAVYFAVGYASMKERVKSGYTSGLLTASYPFGAGRFLINSLQILENVDRHPAADRLLLNTINYAASLTAGPMAPLPDNFDAQLQAIAYRR